MSRAPGYNAHEVASTEVWKDNFALDGMYGLKMQNGILLWAALGKSTTAGTDPYTHTITPTTDGTAIPSFTINVEQKGTATDEEYQFQGCKVDNLMLYHDLGSDTPNLAAKVKWKAAKATDGYALTADPALPPTANANSYVNLERKWDVAGANLSIDGLKKVEVIIGNGLIPVYADTWDTGTFTGMWVQEFLERPLKMYRVNMELHPSTIERAVWDDLISTAVSKQITLKWIRSANDYILVTVNGPIVQHDIRQPLTGQELIETVVMEPYAMSVEVKDSIVGTGYYGE